MIRPVETEAEIEAFLAIRSAVDPENPMTRESWDASRADAGRLDVLLLEAGEPVGCAFAEQMYGDPASVVGWVSVRVLPAHRRRGHGTALLRHCSDHLRALGCTRLCAGTVSTAASTIGFLGAFGFEEAGRMQDVELVLGADVDVAPPPGIEIVPLTEDRDEGAHAVALEADADVPAAHPVVTGDLARWRERNLDDLALREQSFVALDGDEVVGYAILGRELPGIAVHYMTGVRRSHRGRGIATALKRAQIRAAREAGFERLRTQNDLANAPMRAVNDRLGYRPRLEWVQLRGPLLG